MNSQKLPVITVAGTAIALLCGAIFLGLTLGGANRHLFAVALAIGWIAAFLAARPLVDRAARSALWFSFAVLGFFLFFVYETYEYTGKVRLFPLLIGYSGIVLSILDVLSLTASRAGTFVTRMFGKAFNVSNLEGRTIGRELAVLAGMVLIVLAILLLGFLIAGPLVVMAWMRIAGGKRVGLTLATGVATLVFIYLLFELALQYELYRGLIYDWIKNS